MQYGILAGLPCYPACDSEQTNQKATEGAREDVRMWAWGELSPHHMQHAAIQGNFTSLHCHAQTCSVFCAPALCAAIAQARNPTCCSETNEQHNNHNCLCAENVVSLPCEHGGQKGCAVYTVQLIYISRRLACISTHMLPVY